MAHGHPQTKVLHKVESTEYFIMSLPGVTLRIGIKEPSQFIKFSVKLLRFTLNTL